MMVRRTRATFLKAMPEMFFREVTADTIVLFDRPAAGAIFQCSCYRVNGPIALIFPGGCGRYSQPGDPPVIKKDTSLSCACG
jgi:hypothetical protein